MVWRKLPPTVPSTTTTTRWLAKSLLLVHTPVNTSQALVSPKHWWHARVPSKNWCTSLNFCLTRRHLETLGHKEKRALHNPNMQPEENKWFHVIPPGGGSWSIELYTNKVVHNAENQDFASNLIGKSLAELRVLMLLWLNWLNFAYIRPHWLNIAALNERMLHMHCMWHGQMAWTHGDLDAKCVFFFYYTVT